MLNEVLQYESTLFVKLCPTLSQNVLTQLGGLWIENNSTHHLQVSYSIMQHPTGHSLFRP